MKYRSVAQARQMPGLRLVLGAQTPGPWSIAARALFSVRKVPFVPVRQDVLEANAELVAWTGIRNAPVAVYEDEPPRENWFAILQLAERLGNERGETPSLFPDDPLERALAVGISAEICGEGGFGWSRRIAMAGAAADRADAVMASYGVQPENVAAAERRVAAILQGLSAQLNWQREAGSAYLVGDRLTACDVYWACFSQLVAPLSDDQIVGLDERLRAMFAALSDETRDALDPALVAHRDFIWSAHIGLPLEYLPEED